MPETPGPPIQPSPEPQPVLEAIAGPPKPEAKSGRLFSVEVTRPETWFDAFLQAQKGETPRRGFTVGRTEFTDDIASDVRTTVKVVGGEKDESTAITLETKINYSSPRLEKDGGFNPTGEAVRVAKILREKGVKVKFATSPDGKQIMVLDREGIVCGIDLGWSSPQEKPIKPPEDLFGRSWRNMTRFRQDNNPSPAPEEVRQNESIHIVLADEKLEGDVIRSKNAQELSGKISGYAQMVGDFVDAYYQVRGAQPQHDTLTLGIPDWESYIGDDPSLAHVVETPISPGDFSRFLGSARDEIGILLSEEERKTMPTFDEIGGQPEAVEEAKKLVMAIKYADVFAKRGVDRPRGVLLQGPPGTGKTLLAKAIAREAGAEYMSLSVTDLVSKWFGEAEQRVQAFFDRAKALADQGRDVITFIDEIDSVVPSREGAHEATQKMVAVFLQNMDGLRRNPRLTILAASNQPEKIDDAFKRPGRLDKKIEVGLPNADGRAQILNIHLQKRAADADDPSLLMSPDLDTHSVAVALGNVSGADIAGIVNLALEEKVTAEIRHLEGLEGGKPWTPLTAEDLLATRDKYLKRPVEKRLMGFVTTTKSIS